MASEILSEKDGKLTIGLFIESDGPGGAETILVELAKGLTANGHRVLALVPSDGEGWLPGRLAEVGMQSVKVSVTRSISPRSLFRLCRVIREYDLDVVHGHEFTMAVYGTAASMLTGVPLVATMHGGGYHEKKLRRRWALRWAAKNSDAFVAVSGETRGRLQKCLRLDAGEIQVVHNGVSIREGVGAGVRSSLGVGLRETLLLSVGSLYTVKGHDILIRSLSLLPLPVRRSTWLAIAGRGSRRSALEDLAQALELSDKVLFLGHRTDVPDLLAAADVFILPSRSEGLPLALLEAMSAGLPIVATKVGGVPEVVGEGTHCLMVPPEDPASLAGALTELYYDDNLRQRLGRAARNTAREQFSLQAMVSSYEQIYYRVVDRNTDT